MPPPILTRVSLDKETCVVPGPVSARGAQRLLRGDQDQQVDQLALREAGVEERTQPLAQVVRVPEGPLGVGAIRRDVSLMMSLAGLTEKLLELRSEILGHQVLLRSPRATIGTKYGSRNGGTTSLGAGRLSVQEARCPSHLIAIRVCGVSTTNSLCSTRSPGSSTAP